MAPFSRTTRTTTRTCRTVTRLASGHTEPVGKSKGSTSKRVTTALLDFDPLLFWTLPWARYTIRPMAQIREIRKRMVAVGTIARITKTMQMIATAKFTAAVARAKATKPYTTRIRQLVAEVAAAAGDVEHPLISGPAESPKREVLLVITSDRGLCGAYNSNVLRKAISHARDLRSRNIAFNLE